MWKQNGNEHLNVYHQYVVYVTKETMCYRDWEKKFPLIRFIPTFYRLYSIHRIITFVI